MLATLLPPRLLKRIDDCSTLLSGTAVPVVALLVGMLTSSYTGLVAVWAVIGVGYSLVLTLSGRILRRSASPGNRPALFAARFTLSHGCWLITYPLAGWLGATAGMTATYVVLAAITALGAFAAAPCGLPQTRTIDMSIRPLRTITRIFPARNWFQADTNTPTLYEKIASIRDGLSGIVHDGACRRHVQSPVRSQRRIHIRPRPL